MTIRPLTPELAKVAANELGEVPERIQQDLQAIKDWLSKQSHIKARTDDQWLIAFLRGCKFSLERTKEKLDNYYSVKAIIPELANGIDPADSKIQSILDKGVCLPLPNLSKVDGPRHILIRISEMQPKDYEPMDMLKIMLMISNIQMLEDDNWTVAGTTVLSDLTNFTAGHLVHMTPINMKKMVTTRQEAMPVRQKGVIQFNVPSGVETVFNIVKSFLNEKNRSRFRIVSTIEDLYEYVPKEILPVEYGGNGGTIQEIIDHWKKKTMEYRDWFLEDVQFKTDEKKRPGKPKTADEMFGIEGSFRQLNVD